MLCLKVSIAAILVEKIVGAIALSLNGNPVAAMTLITEPEELERFLLANNPKSQQILEKSRQSLKEEGGLKSDDFWKLVGK